MTITELEEERRQLIKAMQRISQKTLPSPYELLYTRWREVDDSIQLIKADDTSEPRTVEVEVEELRIALECEPTNSENYPILKELLDKAEYAEQEHFVKLSDDITRHYALTRESIINSDSPVFASLPEAITDEQAIEYFAPCVSGQRSHDIALLTGICKDCGNKIRTITSNTPAITDEKQKALNDFVFTINATGGAVRHENGNTGVAIDPEWTDLGAAYIRACAVLELKPELQDAATGLPL